MGEIHTIEYRFEESGSVTQVVRSLTKVYLYIELERRSVGSSSYRRCIFGRNQTLRVVLFHLCEFLTLAACFPSALRVLFGNCFKVCFRFAALTAFLMFFLAAVRCLRLAIRSSLKGLPLDNSSARSRGRPNNWFRGLLTHHPLPVRILLRRGRR